MRAAQDQAWVASDTPGRLRVRVHRSLRQPELMGRVREHLTGQAGVGPVEVHPATGSILVRYETAARSRGDVLSALRELGLVVREAASVGGPPRPRAGPSALGIAVVDAARRADRWVSSLAEGRTDLKVLFPLAVGALGLRKVARDGLGLADMPAFVLLWYAFDAFHKFHRAPPEDGAPTGGAPRVAGRRRAPRTAAGGA